MLDEMLSKTYNNREYNCLNFASDVWEKYTGSNILRQFIGGGNFVRSRHNFKKIAKPENPCIALFDNEHIGIYIDGKIFHLNETGAMLERLDTLKMKYKKVVFYIENNSSPL